jgi:RNA polymerase sigma-70 factor (ECF subfamily)
MRVMELLRRSERTDDLGSSYLWRVAYTATVDEIRRLRRRREVAFEDASPERPAPDADPERAHAGSEIGEGLAACLARLVQARRLAVALYLQGHSVPEAARLLGWGEKRVENLVFRGLADLRRCLAAKGLTP